MKRKNSPTHHQPLSWPSVILGGVLLFLSAQVISAQLFFNGGAQRRTKALANAKSIAGGLLMFKSDKGAYPCDATRRLMEDDGIKNLPAGKSANAYFAQLIASEALDTEKVFFTPEKGFRLGDDDMKTSKPSSHPAKMVSHTSWPKAASHLLTPEPSLPSSSPRLAEKEKASLSLMTISTVANLSWPALTDQPEPAISTKKDISGRPAGKAFSKPAGIPSSVWTFRNWPTLFVRQKNSRNLLYKNPVCPSHDLCHVRPQSWTNSPPTPSSIKGLSCLTRFRP